MKLQNKNGVNFYSRPGLTLHKEKMLYLLSEFVSICERNNIYYWLDGGGLLGFSRHGEQIPWDDDLDICLPYHDYIRFIEIFNNKNTNKNLNLYFNSKGLRSWCEYLCLNDSFYETQSGFIKPIKIDLFPVKSINKNQIDKDISIVDKLSSVIKTSKQQKISKTFKSKKDALDYKINLVNEYYDYMNSLDYDVQDCYLVKGHGQFSPIKKIEKKYVFPLQFSQFCNIKVLVPYDINKYLETSYGLNYLDLPVLSKRKPSEKNAFIIKKSEQNLYKIKVDIITTQEYLEFFYSMNFKGKVVKLKNLILLRGFAKTFSSLIYLLSKKLF